MKFRFVDLFCGGGGSITGAINALNTAGVKYDGRGFNHWDLAIKTIQANHPECVPNFERACADIAEISGRPWAVFDDDPTRIDVLWASPSCTHHSNAAGGTPRSEQLRSQPEHLLPFLRLTKCRRMFVENVKELKNWGPLLDKDTIYKGKKYKAGQADPRKAGLFFNDWLREVRHSGYDVDIAILNAADYGAATSRERLIIQAVRKSSGEKIVWPDQTHSCDPDLFGYKPWRSAAEIIDWNIPGESIFDREKPLCENTLRRIEAGIKKYWGAWAEPFLVALHSIEKTSSESAEVPTPVNLPLVSPFITRYNGGKDRNHSVNSPVPVIDCSNRYGVVSPLFIPQHSGGTVKPCDGNPTPTITTSGAVGVVTPLLSAYYGNGFASPVKSPVPTISTKDRFGLVTPLLLSYYGNSSTVSLTKPIPAITTHDKFGLVQGRILTLPDGQRYKLDITHRMLTARELAAATGFPDGYVFVGGDTAAKKMIGNAVCPDLARALYLSILAA